MSGTLRDAGTHMPLTNRRAYLYWTEDPTDYDSWELVGYADSASGEFSGWASGIQRRTYYSWWFDGDTAYEEGWSADLKIMARAKLSPPAYPSIVRRGVTVAAWGTLQPRHSADQNKQNHTKAALYHYSRGAWRAEGTKWAASYRNTTTATRYKVSCPFRLAGRWRARAIHVDDDHAKTVSAWRYFRVN